jgi:hypothetical protein
VSVYATTPAPTVPIWTHGPAVDAARSIRNAVSLLALSVQLSSTLVVDCAIALRPLGDAGVASATCTGTVAVSVPLVESV